jgi:hypothetical protein
VSALSDLINQELSRRGLDGASLRDLSERSDNRLSKDAVRIYRAGLHGRPTEEVLTAWSELLGTPISDLRRAADVPAGEQGPYVLPAEASRLSERQRAAVTELIRAFVGGERPAATSRRRPSAASTSGERYSAEDLTVDPGVVAAVDQIKADVAARRHSPGRDAGE